MHKLQPTDITTMNEFKVNTNNMTTLLEKRAKVLDTFIKYVENEVLLRKVDTDSFLNTKNGKLCSVDGSNNEAESLGLFISVISSAGIIMNGLLDANPTRIIHGYPKELELSELASIEDLVSIKRDVLEAKTAIEIIDQLDPNSGYIFIDGPLLPPDNYIRGAPPTPEDIENIDDIYMQAFVELIGTTDGKKGLITELIEKSLKKNIPLIGIVKRPRSIDYISRIVGRDICEKYHIHDGLILDSIITTAQELQNSYFSTDLVPITQKLMFRYLQNINAGDILYTYLVPATGAPPIRVEIPKWVDITHRVEEVLSITILSSSNTIGIPLPILLAHMTCKIPDELKNLLWRELEFKASKLGLQGLELIKKYRGRSP